MLSENVLLSHIVLHKVGNPSRGEELRLSKEQLHIEDEIVQRLLTRYFLAPFNENELYQFSHLSDLSLNEVYTYISRIFEDPARFLEQSALIAEFLYSKSTHVKVKEGELYIARFEKLFLHGEEISAIGIFKSETKETFLKLRPRDTEWELTHDEGININKLDKGCLILHTDTHDGFRLCVVDNTNKQQDAQYWINDFLQVRPVADSYHHTDKYLSLCKSFVTSEYANKFEVTKSDQADLLNRSIDYFKNRDQFKLQEFTEEVIHHPELVDTFMQYKQQFQSSRNFEIGDEFDIHLAAVKKQQKVFKTVLKLDRNFHIYIHGRRDLIERGTDELGRKYYKIFYEEET